MVKKITIIVFIILSCFTFSGCVSYSAKIADAERIIDKLEQSATSRGIEYTTLEGLLESERERNTELQRLTDNYTEAEQRRLEAERGLVNNLESIFKSRQDILSKLITVTEEIRKYILSLEDLE